MVSIKPFNIRQNGAKMTGLKTDEFSFHPVSLLKIEFFSKIFLMFFYFQETPILMNN